MTPGHRDRLVVGDLTSLPSDATYPVVVGIQVFQHGNRAEAHERIRQAQRRVAAGGLFALRVNAIGTDVYPAHEIIDDASAVARPEVRIDLLSGNAMRDALIDDTSG